MNKKDNPQNVINKFSKRQKSMPYILGVLAGLLALAGILIIVSVATGSKNPFKAIFATKTPTATATFTPTATVPSPTPPMTPTMTETVAPSPTNTPSGPQIYEVKQYDTCWSIATAFDVDLAVLLAINSFPSGTCPIVPGQKIYIPAPNQQLPTATPLPTGLPRGFEIEYTVQMGDTLAGIAAKFNSTIEDIIRINNIKDQNAISVGQVLKVRINLVTPTPTVQPTSTLSGYLVTPPGQTAVPTFTPTPNP